MMLLQLSPRHTCVNLFYANSGCLNSEFDVNLQIIMIYKNNPVVVNDM